MKDLYSKKNDEKPLEEEFYKMLTIKKGLYAADIIRGSDITAKYVRRENRILTGGMAIDFALRLKGASLYDEDELADYDFYTPQHYHDAYEIGLWLVRTKFPYVTVINGLHATTMRVRVAYEAVADVTYIPQNIYDEMPTLRYKGYRIIHPNFQIINQHRALSKPYENPPREVIMGPRWKKDMERHDLLYSHYPLEKPTGCAPGTFTTHKLPNLDGHLVGGMAALVYWLQRAKAEGFECATDYGYWKPGECKISSMLALYTYHPDPLRDHYKGENLVYHNALLNFLPPSWRGTGIEIYHVFDDLRTGFKEAGGYTMANLQLVMVYFLTKIIIGKDTNKYLYDGYLTARALIAWASTRWQDEKSVARHLLPSVIPYGHEENLSESIILRRYMFEHRAERVQRLQPKNMQTFTVYRNDIPPEMRKFDYSSSWIFSINGLPTTYNEGSTEGRPSESTAHDGGVP